VRAPAAVPDPRRFPEPARALPLDASLYALAAASLGADTGGMADAADRDVRNALHARLAGDGPGLARLLAQAPSVAVARYLWRQLDHAWREAGRADALAATLFAIPLVVVAGLEARTGEIPLPGVLADRSAVTELLREHGALRGNRAFALADALVAADAIDIPLLPAMLEWQRLDEHAAVARLAGGELKPAPLTAPAGREAVHLRFIIGTALAGPGVDVLADATVGRWGTPLTRELARQLSIGAARVLALPRAAQRPLPAVKQGRSAQREISAQLFLGNALRRMRAVGGEPTAVISAHRAPDAPGGGELRVSLSSPFDPRDDEGFRCPLHPFDRVAEVVTMLEALLADCRVADVRLVGGVHPDRDPATGQRLLFKRDAIPDELGRLH